MYLFSLKAMFTSREGKQAWLSASSKKTVNWKSDNLLSTESKLWGLFVFFGLFLWPQSYLECLPMSSGVREPWVHVQAYCSLLQRVPHSLRRCCAPFQHCTPLLCAASTSHWHAESAPQWPLSTGTQWRKNKETVSLFNRARTTAQEYGSIRYVFILLGIIRRIFLWICMILYMHTHSSGGKKQSLTNCRRIYDEGLEWGDFF